MNFSKLLDLIEEQGKTFYQVEKEAGLGNGTIRKWARDEANPTIANLQKVADALGVDVATLV